MKKPEHCDSRKGDLAEFYAITWLWDRGYEVFKNCGCTGSVDLLSMNNKGEIKLIDVKTLGITKAADKSGKEIRYEAVKNSRTEEQKKLGVQLLGFNPETRKLRFIKHQEEQDNATT